MRTSRPHPQRPVYTGMAPRLSPAAFASYGVPVSAGRYKPIGEARPWAPASNVGRPAPRSAEVLPATERGTKW